MNKKGEGISIRHLMTLSKWERDYLKAQGVEAVTDYRLFVELERGTLPEGLAPLVLEELRKMAETTIKQHEGSARGGRQSKRREWAEWVAQRVTCWEEIPSHEIPFTYGNVDEHEIYRDGNTLVKADAYNADAKPDTLKRSTFERWYLNKKRQ